MTPFRASVSSRAGVLIAGAALLLACGASNHDTGDAAGAGDHGSDNGGSNNGGSGEAGGTGLGGSAPTGTESTAPASDPAPPAPGVYRGTYFVPVPPELEPYALFELESVRVELRGDELGLQYDLPELLLGEPHRLSFRGVASEGGEYRLEGDDGVATCRASAGRWKCDEVLNGIALDASKIDRLLASMSDAEARARRDVADRFTVDPIGVLELLLSPTP